ncbi:MAG: Maf family protein [Bryobacteraceae bacterium]
MLVLASASPRRAELLSAAGIAFTVRPARIDETRAPSEPARDYVIRLAREKALAVAAAPDEIVLAADTTVLVDNHILEKPADPADAARMIRLLAGRTHEVLTGICLRRGRELVSDCEVTRVRFLPLSDADIAEYVASGEPMDKAGAYGIQGLASKFIDRVEGCYFNVVGLPVSMVWRHWRTMSCRSL